MIIENNKINIKNIAEQDIIVLAFLGDAIHTLFVREFLLSTSCENAGKLHLKASRFCKAKHQAMVLDSVLNDLSEEELSIIRRARNHKSTHIPKNVDIETYKKATAFESLIGYYYVLKMSEKLNELLNKSLKEY